MVLLVTHVIPSVLVIITFDAVFVSVPHITQNFVPFQTILENAAVTPTACAVQVIPSVLNATVLVVPPLPPPAMAQNVVPFHAMSCQLAFTGSVKSPKNWVSVGDTATHPAATELVMLVLGLSHAADRVDLSVVPVSSAVTSARMLARDAPAT
jgi:hypothetical protein